MELFLNLERYFIYWFFYAALRQFFFGKLNDLGESIFYLWLTIALTAIFGGLIYRFVSSKLEFKENYRFTILGLILTILIFESFLA